MNNIHSLNVDLRIVNEPHREPKHYRLRLLMENNKNNRLLPQNNLRLPSRPL